MSATDFYSQQSVNKDAWGHRAYEEFRDQFFFTGMLSKGVNACVEHITDLSKNNKGEAGAWMHLITDIHGGGVVGDNTLEGRERDLEASWIRANFDYLRNAMVTKGRKSDQKSVIDARKQFRQKMARWLAESLEEQGILTASGISYAFNTDGSARSTPAGQDAWTDLDYAADVSAPTTNRHVRWDAANGFEAGDTTQVAVADVPTYAMIPELEAIARSKNLSPIRVGGDEHFVFLCHTDTMAKLWRDSDFRSIVVNAGSRGNENPIFKGAFVTMNGLIIKPYRRVYTTKGAASGSKWGAGSAINGSRSLLLGSQALGMVDLGALGWDEDEKDYGHRWGLAVNKAAGWIKPKFKDSLTGTVEDYSIVAVDHSI